MKNIEVEFFGIARQRINETSTKIPVEGPIPLHDVLHHLSKRFPNLVPDCIEDGRLTRICTVNVNGDRFVTDADYQICPSDRILIMSADAGG